MRSSLLNLIVGIVWSGLWLYRAFFVLVPDGGLPVALVELAITLPLGIGGILDGVLHGRRGDKAFVLLPDWTSSDVLFFATGGVGLVVFVLSLFLPWIDRDLALMGAVATGVSVAHYVRRKIYMSQARSAGDPGLREGR